MNQRQVEIKSPLGPLYLVASAQGLQGIFWHKREVPWLQDAADEASAVWLFQAAEQVQSYLEGSRKQFDLTLDCQGTAFQREVWDQLRKIPYGQTISYKDLAMRINRPKAYRAVGTANGKNPFSLVVPCHRVIANDAGLGGYAGGLANKAWLLRLGSARA